MKTKRFIALLLVFVLLATTTHLVQRQIRGKLGEAPPMDILYLPKGEYVKIIAMGFDSFMADLLWIRAIQYFGGHFMFDSKFPVIDRLLEVITTLEPTFQEVYTFGAMVLHDEMHQREKAIALLDRGIENNPNSWHIAYDKGFLWFEELRSSKDTTFQVMAAQKAMEAYSLATTKPDCPDFVGRIVIQMKYEAGWKDLAREMWRQKLEEAEKNGDKLAASIYRDKLLKDKYQEIVLPVIQALYKYYQKYKKGPPQLSDLVKEGFIDRIPPDPLTGEPLQFDPRTGRVWSRLKPQFSTL